MSEWDVLRLITLILAGLGVVTWVWFLLIARRYWGYAIGPITWLGNLAAFYLTYFMGVLPNTTLNAWSSVIQLHGVFLCCAYLAVLISERVVHK